MGGVMQPLAAYPAHSSGQSPPVSGRPRRPGGSSLLPVPRDYARIIGISVIIKKDYNINIIILIKARAKAKNRGTWELSNKRTFSLPTRARLLHRGRLDQAAA